MRRSLRPLHATSILFALALLFALPSSANADAPSRRTLDDSATLRHARQMIASIARHARRVQSELRHARTRGDSADARCLSQKLSEIHAQERLARDREDDLADALARGDNRRLLHGRVVLGLLRDRARELSRQARRCGRFADFPEHGYQVRVLRDDALAIHGPARR